MLHNQLLRKMNVETNTSTERTPKALLTTNMQSNVLYDLKEKKKKMSVVRRNEYTKTNDPIKPDEYISQHYIGCPKST